MTEFDYDFFVIGAGSGGVRAARTAGSLGARVAIAEQRAIGGTCVNVGCIPKKLLSYAAHYSGDFEDARAYGWTVDAPRFDWKALISNKDREVERLNGVYQRLLEKAGCHILRGRARLVDRHTISIGDARYTAEYILIATGSHAESPGIEGEELAITSNEAFFLDELPERTLIVGGGYIALEFASIFRGLGREVHLVHRGALPLRTFDEDIRRCIATELEKRGVIMHMRQKLRRIGRHDGALRVETRAGAHIDVDLVLCAIGRLPNTADLGLEEVGVELSETGGVKVGHRLQTSVRNIYAVGDVIDRIQLTPVALAEGTCVAHDLFSDTPHALEYRNISTAVFSQPPVATVGLTEHEAREHSKDIDVYISEFRPLKHTIGDNPSRSLMKLIVDGTTGRVLGCHMVGDDAPEIIQGFAVALNVGATKAQLDATIGLHPTAAEEFVTMRTKRA